MEKLYKNSKIIFLHKEEMLALLMIILNYLKLNSNLKLNQQKKDMLNLLLLEILELLLVNKELEDLLKKL